MQEKSGLSWASTIVIAVIIILTLVNGVLVYQLHNVKKDLVAASARMFIAADAREKVANLIQSKKSLAPNKI
jgi:uncharacterized membrane protein YvbJ